MPAVPPVTTGSPSELKWQQVLAEIKKNKPLVADFLETYKNKKFSEGEIVLLIPDGMLLERIKTNIHFVEPAVRKIFGEQTRLRCEPLQKNAPISARPAVTVVAPVEKTLPEVIEEVDDSPPSDADEPPVEKRGDVFEVGPEKHKANVISDPVIKKVADAFHGKIVNK